MKNLIYKEILDEIEEFAQTMRDDGDDYVLDYGKRLSKLLTKLGKKYSNRRGKL